MDAEVEAMRAPLQNWLSERLADLPGVPLPA